MQKFSGAGDTPPQAPRSTALKLNVTPPKKILVVALIKEEERKKYNKSSIRKPDTTVHFKQRLRMDCYRRER